MPTFYHGDTNKSVFSYLLDADGEFVSLNGETVEIVAYRLLGGIQVGIEGTLISDPFVSIGDLSTPYSANQIVHVGFDKTRIDLPDALLTEGADEIILQLLTAPAEVVRLYHEPILLTTDKTPYYKLIEADMRLDKTVTPWEFVWYERGTLVELMRKEAVDMDGNPVISTTQKIGSLTQ